MGVAFELRRAPTTDDELWLVIKALWGIELPRVQVCPDHTSPFKAVADAYFAREPGYAVWYASRGSGKSLALAVLGLTKTLVDDVDTTILGGSMTQSQNVATHMSDLLHFKRAPTYALKGGSIAKGVTATQITTNTGHRIRPIPASQTTVRGPHPPLSLLDEVDEMEYKIYEAAMGQAMEQMNSRGEIIGEYIVASSTWQNTDGCFTKVMEQARKKGLPIHTWCWRELLQPHGWMSQRFINQKKQAVSEEMWRCLPTDEPVQTRRGDVAIQDIKDGDEVWTRAGWRDVTALVPQPARPIYTVTTDDGRSVRATGNHPFAVPGGWARADELAAGDVLITADPPLVLTGTGPAHPVAFGVDKAVDGADVAVDARLTRGVAVAFGSVGASAQQGQVSGVDALGDVAVMLDRQPLWDVTIPRDEGYPVGVAATADQATDAIAVLGHGAGPQPASRLGWSRPLPDVALMVGDTRLGLVGDEARPTPSNTATSDFGTAVDTGECRVASVLAGAPMPTWDLSVYECHEFTVQGVLVHNTEYELNEPSGASRAFDLTKLEQYFEPYPTPVDYRENGEDDQTWVWEDPQGQGMYAVGADWAKEIDKTVIACIRYDVNPRRLVYLRRVNRQPYPAMIKSFDDVIHKYNAVGLHDKTGLGNVVHDFSTSMENGEVGGFNFSDRRKRSQMLLQYVTDVENGGYRLPRGDNSPQGQYLGEFHKAHRSTTTADVYGTHMTVAVAGKHHLPDDVAAMGLAHRAAGRIPQGMDMQAVPVNPAPRQVDKPFHAKPFDDEWEMRSGDVTVVDERYDAPIADFGFLDLSI